MTRRDWWLGVLLYASHQVILHDVTVVIAKIPC